MAGVGDVQEVFRPLSPGGPTIKITVAGVRNRTREELRHLVSFVTLHDMGTNHNSWMDFFALPSSRDLTANVLLFHVCLPGQDYEAADMGGPFPNLDDLARDLLGPLLRTIQEVSPSNAFVLLGEGAGANIACRMTIQHPQHIYGLVLVHCTSTVAGLSEQLRDWLLKFTLSGGQMSDGAIQYLTFQKFGQKNDANNANVRKFTENLKLRMNHKNVGKYLEAFEWRRDLSQDLRAGKLRTKALVICGEKASHLHTVETMYSAMAGEKTNKLIVERAGDVATEAPEKLKDALVLFLQGVGFLSDVRL